MAKPTGVHEAIDDLVLNAGERDSSAKFLVPPLESDPLLIGLALLAREMREKAALSRLSAGGVQFKGSATVASIPSMDGQITLKR